jgi:predicted nucleic acid-binding protein
MASGITVLNRKVDRDIVFAGFLNEDTEARAATLMEEMHVQPVDALHLAAAEAAQVDYFITCDYAVIKRYQGDITVVSPLSFIHEYKHDDKNHHV